MRKEVKGAMRRGRCGCEGGGMHGGGEEGGEMRVMMRRGGCYRWVSGEEGEGYE